MEFFNTRRRLRVLTLVNQRHLDFSPNTVRGAQLAALFLFAHRIAAVGNQQIRKLRPWRQARGRHSSQNFREPKSSARLRTEVTLDSV
jgi:hypothetical protein